MEIYYRQAMHGERTRERERLFGFVVCFLCRPILISLAQNGKAFFGAKEIEKNFPFLISKQNC